jgi:SOS-response transcriptional repressor LexA
VPVRAGQAAEPRAAAAALGPFDESRLTPRQYDVLQAIRVYHAQQGMPPTIREIGRAVGVSINAVNGHLCRLEEKGFLRRIPNISRGIFPTTPVAPAGDRRLDWLANDVEDCVRACRQVLDGLDDPRQSRQETTAAIYTLLERLRVRVQRFIDDGRAQDAARAEGGRQGAGRQ